MYKFLRGKGCTNIWYAANSKFITFVNGEYSTEDFAEYLFLTDNYECVEKPEEEEMEEIEEVEEPKKKARKKS